MKLWRIVADFVFNRTSGDRGKTPGTQVQHDLASGDRMAEIRHRFDGGRCNNARVDIICPGFCPYYNFRG